MKTKILIGFCCAIVLFLAGGLFYTVPLNQYAAVRQLGRIVRIEEEPGLRIKLPYVQNVQLISKSLKLYDVPLSDVITRDKKSIIADNSRRSGMKPIILSTPTELPPFYPAASGR